MNEPIEAKYYRDLHVLERLNDINLRTALVLGIDPSNYLDLKVDPSSDLNLKVDSYLMLVFKSVLPRLSPVEVLQILNKTIEKVADETYNPSTSNKAGELTKLLREKVQIKDLAAKYELKIKGNKMVCPFHADKDPSLAIYPKTNSFYCFGCNVGGDVIEFYRLMENLK